MVKVSVPVRLASDNQVAPLYPSKLDSDVL